MSSPTKEGNQLLTSKDGSKEESPNGTEEKRLAWNDAWCSWNDAWKDGSIGDIGYGCNDNDNDEETSTDKETFKAKPPIDVEDFSPPLKDDGKDKGNNALDNNFVPMKKSNCSINSQFMNSLDGVDIESIGKCIQSERNYPEDTYSFIALNKLTGTKEERFFFLYGLLPFLFQIALLVLMLWSSLDPTRGTVGDSGNPDQEKNGFFAFLAVFIPPKANMFVRITQLTAMAAYMIYPESSLHDLVMSVRCFPNPTLVKKGDPVKSMMFACAMRFTQGTLAVFSALLLVMTSTTPVDIVLNFTAVNFVSSLDDAAFKLAKSGSYGPKLKGETKRIANTELPPCMHRASKHIYYRIVLGTTSCILFMIIALIIYLQTHDQFWVTRTLRVQFQEETGLNEFSGCYGFNDDSSVFGRSSYTSFDDGPTNTSFGYCIEDHKWILYRGDSHDPCGAKENGLELARSSETDSFDISDSFDESWASSGGTPLDLYFFDEDEEKIQQYCNSTLGDGVCDPNFNSLGYNYDEGDCCAATCTKSRCGTSGLTEVFGNPNVTGTGFPHCEDPKLKPITIHLNDISSSRDPRFANFTNDVTPWSRYKPFGEEKWRAVTPVKAYASFVCNDKVVMEVYLDDSMVNRSETLMVEDGAKCTFLVRNTTTGKGIEAEDPIWLVNYTIYHGKKENTEYRLIEILTHHSHQGRMINFVRIPECYFKKLQGRVDYQSIYTAADPPNKAINWLVNDEFSQCEDDTFIERYALITSMFGLSSQADFARTPTCGWDNIACTDGRVSQIIAPAKFSLAGSTPNEIKSLKRLEQLKLSENRITSISDIGSVTSLQLLDFRDNDIKYIPTEIQFLTNLKYLDIGGNQVKSIPSEIGLLTDLEELHLNDNQVTFIPKEIGLLTNLEELALNNNQIVSIPTEVGLLSKLGALHIGNNQIKSLPTEIGLLPNLQHIHFENNQISSIPTEIGLNKNLSTIVFSKNDIAFIPSEIGSLTNLRVLAFVWCGVTSIPAEIWSMTSLELIASIGNVFEAIPTEIGLMTNLNLLYFQSNGITIMPSEIGLLTNLEEMILKNNQLSSIPSEIGLMTKLRTLRLDDNELASIPSEIGSISMLEKCTISRNQVKHIPSEISLMTGLRHLSFDANQIKIIPTEIGLLTNLEIADFGDNQIESIPSGIGYMSKLHYFNFGNNSIVSIPSEIGLLRNLETMNVSSNEIDVIPSEIGLIRSLELWFISTNQITSVPSEIGLMTNLQIFDLSTNQINSIPSEVGTMTNLEYFIVDDNQITSIPSQIGLLTNLKELWIFNNNISSIPDEVFSIPNVEMLDDDLNGSDGELPSQLLTECIVCPLDEIENPLSYIEPINLDCAGLSNLIKETIVQYGTRERCDEAKQMSRQYGCRCNSGQNE